MSGRRTRLVRALVLLAAVLAAGAFLYIRYVPKYPEPAYGVADYEALAAALERLPDVRLPAREALPAGALRYAVLLDSRVSGRPDGYAITGFGHSGGRQVFAAECRSLAVLQAGGPDVPLEALRADRTHRAVPIQVYERDGLSSAVFDWGERRYRVSMLDGDALAFARGLLDRILDGQ